MQKNRLPRPRLITKRKAPIFVLYSLMLGINHYLFIAYSCLWIPLASAQYQPPIFINAGGNDYIDPEGNVWVPDTGFYNTGLSYSTASSILNTNVENIYQSERYDTNKDPDMKYTIPLLPGEYNLTLHFAEIYPGAFRNGARKFDVVVEGSTVVQDFDIFQEAGGEGNKAVVLNTEQVVVNDGALTIDFLKKRQSPKINGIEIHPAMTSPTDVTTPSFGVSALVLVDAVTDTDIPKAFDCSPNACLGTAKLFNIRAETFGTVGSVRLTSAGSIDKVQIENIAPYALFGDNGGDYLGEVLPQGEYVITAQAFRLTNGQGEASAPFSISFSTFQNEPITPAPANPTPVAVGPTPSPVNLTPAPVDPTPAPVNPTPAPVDVTLQPTPVPTPNENEPPTSFGVSDLVLVDADTNQDIDGGLACTPSPCLGDAVNFNIRADTFGAVGSVRLVIDGPIRGNRVENVAPFAVLGDTLGNYVGSKLPTGTYSVMAQAFTNLNAEGEQSAVFSLTFSIFPELNNDIGDCSPNAGECGQCEGDCDNDADCGPGLYCFKRDDDTPTPGCTGLGKYGDDYCYDPKEPIILTYIAECTADSPCGLCEGDCDGNSGCDPGLACFKRNDYEPVPGCGGPGLRGFDYCWNPTFPLSLTIAKQCTIQNPCRECQGGCSSDFDCLGDLVCHIRNGDDPVPGCVTGGLGDVINTNYCHEPLSGGAVTYIPGDITIEQNELLLSTGLTSRLIARSGLLVNYDDGGVSSTRFHSLPDGGGVFPNSGGGWTYTSNSEDYSNRYWNRGGVGALRFDSSGNLINYEMVSVQTSFNCGGGKTWWGTWLTSEEREGGHVWEVDPSGDVIDRKTLLGADADNGGYFESVAYYRPDPLNATFYVTEDNEIGALRRFTPDVEAMAIANDSNDFSQLLHSNPNGTAKIEYLKLSPESSSHGTFTWTTDKSAAKSDAAQHYPYSEGIDIANGVIYMTAKLPKILMILDLETGIYERYSTESGAFDGQPDQIQRILGETAQDDILYFCEDEGVANGVHGRDSSGNFYTILEGPGLGETTGLDFSPDKRAMYISFQQAGLIYEITRDDGYPFGGTRLDIKYHNV